MESNERPTIGDLSSSLSRRLTRRGVLAGVIGLGAMSLLAACGGDDDDATSPAPTNTPAGGASSPTDEPETTSEPVASPTEAQSTNESEATSAAVGDTPFEFTDGRGTVVSLPKRPERIVAFTAAAGALWDYGIRPIGIFGIQVHEDGSVDSSVGSADLSTMTSVGDTLEDLDIEKLLSLQPDLVISTMNTVGNIWGIGADTILDLVEGVAPVIAMSAFFEPIDELIGHFEDLAIALGGDPEAPEAVANRDAFNEVSDEIRSIVEAKPDLSVTVWSSSPENAYFANTDMFPDLIYLKDLRVPFFQPPAEIAFDGPWGMTSWERAGGLPLDVILLDSRGGWPPEDAMSVPIFTAMPAVQAGQIGPWAPLVPLSYGGMNPILQGYADVLAAADPDIA